MSGICSRHIGNDPTCGACQAHPRDIFPDWDKKVAEAEAAGTHKCLACGFVFYKTINICPLCSFPLCPETLWQRIRAKLGF